MVILPTLIYRLSVILIKSFKYCLSVCITWKDDSTIYGEEQLAKNSQDIP